jgi:uridine kinase
VTGRGRSAVLARLADLIAGGVVARVGVDGVDGAGKTTFADDLAPLLAARGVPVVRASADGFHRPRADRYRRGRDDPDGYYLDAFDHGRLRAELLDPLGPGGDRRYRTAVHDLRTDAALDLPQRTAPPDAVLVVDGVFLQRPELAGCFELVVRLDAPFEATYARMARRDASPSDPGHPANRRYLLAQQRYLRECSPRERADVVVDVTDVAAPRLVRPTGSA